MDRFWHWYHLKWMRYHSNHSAWLYCNLPTAWHVYQSGKNGAIAYHEYHWERHRRKLNNL